MDLSRFDHRGRAEEGTFLQLHDPWDKTAPLADENGPAGFRIRGAAAKTAQARLAEMQKNAASAGDQDMSLEKIHGDLIEQAMLFIIEPMNMSLNGRPVETPDDIREVLGMTFPDMRKARDDAGRVKMQRVEIDGKTVSVPELEFGNKPFAMQVIEAAEDARRFFEKTSPN